MTIIPVAVITIDDSLLPVLQWFGGLLVALGTGALALAGKGLSVFVGMARETQGALSASSETHRQVAEACDRLSTHIASIPRCVYGGSPMPHPVRILPQN